MPNLPPFTRFLKNVQVAEACSVRFGNGANKGQRGSRPQAEQGTTGQLAHDGAPSLFCSVCQALGIGNRRGWAPSRHPGSGEDKKCGLCVLTDAEVVIWRPEIRGRAHAAW